MIHQTVPILNTINKIDNALEENVFIDPNQTKELLCKIREELDYFYKDGIDYKIVVDSLDDSVMVTDEEGTILYVNPAHKTNTGILPYEILGQKVSAIQKNGNLFTGGATLDVISTKEKAYRLANVVKNRKNELGYTAGVPIFDDHGNLYQIVISSRPISSLSLLQNDFNRFRQEINSMNVKDNVRILNNSGSSDFQASKLIGFSTSLNDVWNKIKKAAPTDASILITGESGVGKEIVADEIYRLSQRNNNSFIKINCASIPENLLESELFGYEKGAFSGANPNGKKGLFEIANHGTVLLDEIGDMSIDLQAKLLRAIQNKEITRVGGSKAIPIDIRFITSTNCDIKAKISERTFRSDLYYRLNVIPIKIPPLRNRLDDLDQLSSHFLTLYNRKHNKSFELSQELRSIMKSYSWPGNVRELENFIEYLTVCFSSPDEITEAAINAILDIPNTNPIDSTNPDNDKSLKSLLSNYEKRLIESALYSSSNLREAASKLGIDASTVSRKIKEYGIEYKKSKNTNNT